MAGNFTQRETCYRRVWAWEAGEVFTLLNRAISEREKKQGFKTGNLSKAHLHAKSTLPSRDSLEKERKFASVCLERQIY